MTFKKEVAKIFEEARKNQHLTQKQVAKKAGIDDNYYARIERADPDASGEILNKVAKALGVKIKLPLD